MLVEPLSPAHVYVHSPFRGCTSCLRRVFDLDCSKYEYCGKKVECNSVTQIILSRLDDDIDLWWELVKLTLRREWKAGIMWRDNGGNGGKIERWNDFGNLVK